MSALATTSSSVLVRWGPVPEAERNGRVLGYKVSPALGAGGGRGSTGFPTQGALPPGPRLCLQSGHRGSVWLPIHRSPWQPESSLGGGGGASREGMGSLGLHCLPQEATLGAPSLTLSSGGRSVSFYHLLESLPKAEPTCLVRPWPGSREMCLQVPALPLLAV